MPIGTFEEYDEMITIMGATGRIGGQLAHRLLAAGGPVRALGRSAARLATLGAAGAQTVPGDASDPRHLANAFRGAEAVFTMLPFDPATTDFHDHQRRHGEAIAQAIRESGVRRVVALSSIGAELAHGNGPVAALHQQEQRLLAVGGLDLLLLRPGSFFENLDQAPAMIRAHGVLADAYAPDARVPMVATADVAQVAAEALLRRDWRGTRMREVLGPREVSHAEVAQIIGARLGNPDLQYVRMDEGAWIEVLVASGVSPAVAPILTELARAINEGRVRPLEPDQPTNRMATRLEDYVAGLIPAAA